MERKWVRIMVRAIALALIAGAVLFGGVRRGAHVGLVNLKEHPAKAVSQSLHEFSQVDTAFADPLGGGLVSNVINMLRAGVGTVIGFSGTTAYQDLECDGTSTCSGPPQAGIIGTVMAVLQDVQTVAGASGIPTCDAVPASGSITGTGSNGSVTVTFGTPTHTIPAGWVGGGTTFAHRATFNETIDIGGTSTPVAFAWEFNCGAQSSGYVAIAMAMPNVTGYTRDIVGYQGQVNTSGLEGFQVYMAEHDRTDSTKIRGAYALDIQYDSSTSLFDMWGVLSTHLDFTSGPSLLALNKVNIAGNYSTGQALAFDRLISYQPANGDTTLAFDAAILTQPNVSNAGLETDPGNSNMNSDLTNDPTLVTGVSNGTPAQEAFEACINFTSSASANPPSNAACSGFTLVAPADATPALDASGSWSIAWADQTMAGTMEQLPTP